MKLRHFQVNENQDFVMNRNSLKELLNCVYKKTKINKNVSEGTSSKEISKIEVNIPYNDCIKEKIIMVCLGGV